MNDQETKGDPTKENRDIVNQENQFLKSSEKKEEREVPEREKKDETRARKKERKGGR